MIRKTFVALWFLMWASAALAQQQRYLDPIFPNLVITSDIYYGEAVNVETGQLEQLYLDIYEGEGDTLDLRPAVVWAFPNFRNGHKEMDVVVEYCTRFAQHGYVAVAHNYRNHSDPDNFLADAVQQGYEDTKAAIRWLRANWQEWRIDTLKITVGGGSAGAYTSLATAYVEPEGNSGNPGHSSEVSACCEISGTLLDKNDMQVGEAPLLIVHGTEDDRVPFQEALDLEQRALKVGIPYEFYPLEGVGHRTGDLIDQIFPLARDFLYKYVITTGPNGPPTITVDDPAIAEGDSGTTALNFTVQLSDTTASGQVVRVAYSTADSTALATSDYTSASDTLDIPAGSSSGTITVLINGDMTEENDEYFYLNLQNPDNAQIIDLQGVGTIINDENVVPPAAPSGLMATAIDTGQIDLSWIDNSSNESNFRIERRTGAGAFAEIATVGPNVTTYSDTGLAAETTYTYRVRASNSAGTSAYSNEATATTPAPPPVPAAPTSLAATPIGTQRIDLTWVDNSDDEDGFKLERKTGAGGTYSQIATPAANATNYTDLGLTAGTTYFYRIRAYNGVGDSDYSNEASATTATVNQPPVVTINQPVAGKTYPLNQALCYSGTATDPEEGELPAANFEWRVDLPNGVTDHFVASGVKFGQSTPTMAGTYVLKLTVTDGEGTPTTASVTFDASSSAGGNTPPTAVASANPSSGRVPLQVQFTGSGSSDPDGALRYEWDFGDGSTSDQPDPVHTYTAKGSFAATLTVTDDNCATSTDTVTVDALGGVLLQAKAFLQGPYSSATGDMGTTLRDNGLLPTTSPYSEDPRTVSSLPADIVDWILVELRTTPAGSAVLSKSVLLRRDGRIVDDDGVTTQIELDADAGSYYVVLRHRNHLSIMSASALALDPNTSSLFDFTTAQTQAYGTNPMTEVATGVFAMLSGDGNADGGVDAIDRNSVWRSQNGTTWSYSKYGDFNLDGGIDAIDRNICWRGNNGSSTQVP